MKKANLILATDKAPINPLRGQSSAGPQTTAHSNTLSQAGQTISTSTATHKAQPDMSYGTRSD